MKTKSFYTITKIYLVFYNLYMVGAHLYCTINAVSYSRFIFASVTVHLLQLLCSITCSFRAFLFCCIHRKWFRVDFMINTSIKESKIIYLNNHHHAIILLKYCKYNSKLSCNCFVIHMVNLKKRAPLTSNSWNVVLK